MQHCTAPSSCRLLTGYCGSRDGPASPGALHLRLVASLMGVWISVEAIDDITECFDVYVSDHGALPPVPGEMRLDPLGRARESHAVTAQDQGDARTREGHRGPDPGVVDLTIAQKSRERLFR